ncbi:helix-turn-helix transcriptional regulator [Embleya sp. NPDC059237]|uniref:helix-turn-helix domain-containing protein n=1 Tax=Embleya sp. NPDC059237 TaxID=3346784 RepID=UPI0036A1ED65
MTTPTTSVQLRRDRVRDLVAHGLDTAAIAHQLGVDASSIRRDRVALGIPSTSRDVLTHRQRQAVSAGARGLTIEETAAEMWITTHTVYGHRLAVIRRLGARNFTHAVALAIALDQVSADIALTTRSRT